MKSTTVAGFRRPIDESLIWEYRVGAKGDNLESRAWRYGFLSALYTLRANSMPPAFIRSSDVQQIQADVWRAIAHIENIRNGNCENCGNSATVEQDNAGTVLCTECLLEV